ncbi:MAG: flagellar hook-length control protein FliK [Bacteroidota bacterium]
MIPSDVASRLRLLTPEQLQASPDNQPIVPTQKIADVLGGLVPGQRIFAEIQALMPNGTYRAIVAQREIALALPFSAKAGDTMELEVTESDGKIALALVANRSDGAAAKPSTESVSTSLSPAAKLIGTLMNGIETESKRAPPAPLNGSEPLVDKMPRTGAELAPVLKQSLTQSGVFYEAHQARWVAGELPAAALKNEPQGRYPALSVATLPNIATTPGEAGQPASVASATVAAAASESLLYTAKPETGEMAAAALPSENQGKTALAPATIAENSPPGARIGEPGNMTGSQAAAPALAANTPSVRTDADLVSATGNLIPKELTALVQQQLDGLATQNFAWQGQIWPGQQMQWEVGEKEDGSRSQDQSPARQWQTRLKLDLPRLGNIDATLHLGADDQLNVAITTGSGDSEAQLVQATEELRQQFANAGLHLTQFTLRHGEIPE